MADTIGNILVGAATIQVGTYAASGAAGGSMTDIGAIIGGATFDRKAAYHDIISDHHLGILDKIKTSDAFDLKFTMEESQLSNMAIAFDQIAANVSGTGPITFRHNPNDARQLKQIILTTTGPAATPARVFTFWKCVFIECGPIPFKKDGEQLMAVTVAVMQDLTVATGDKDWKVIDT